MAQVYLDPDAIRDAQARLRGLRDTVLHEAQRHASLAGEVEQLLAELGRSILDELDPLHWFDPSPHWEQSGLPYIERAARESRVTIDSVHRHVRSALEHLCAAHGEFVGGRMVAHAEGVEHMLGSALSMLWDVTQFLVPSNLLWFLREPWVPCGRLNEVRAWLEEIGARIDGYIAWLERMAVKEAGVIEELLREAPGAVEKWLKSHAKDLQLGGTILGDIVTLVGAIPKLPGEAGAVVDVLGFVADVAQGGKFSPRDLAVDVYAAGAGAGIGAIPYVGEAYALLGVDSLGLQGVGWLYNYVARYYSGQSRAQLEQLAGLWSEGGKAVDPGPLTHDLGKLAADIQGGEIQLATGGAIDPGIGGFGNLGGDALQALKDTGTLLWGVENMDVVLPIDSIVTDVDVIARQEHAPSWLQGPLDWVAGPGENALESVFHAIKP